MADSPCLIKLSLLLCALGGAGCGAQLPPAICQEQAAALFAPAQQCGPTLDFVPIQKYTGGIAAVQQREDAVALLNGNCTGTLIAASAGPVVLTAGHCVTPGARATVAFNVEEAPDGDTLVTEGEVIEHSTAPDYALLRLLQLPQVTPSPLGRTVTERLAIIQHPRGQPKVVAEGKWGGACQGYLYYDDLDTLVGSSGAGVLSQAGLLIALHTDGDCKRDGSGVNWGLSIETVVGASRYLQPGDVQGAAGAGAGGGSSTVSAAERGPRTPRRS